MRKEPAVQHAHRFVLNRQKRNKVPKKPRRPSEQPTAARNIQNSDQVTLPSLSHNAEPAHHPSDFTQTTVDGLQHFPPVASREAPRHLKNCTAAVAGGRSGHALSLHVCPSALMHDRKERCAQSMFCLIFIIKLPRCLDS